MLKPTQNFFFLKKNSFISTILYLTKHMYVSTNIFILKRISLPLHAEVPLAHLGM